MHRRLLLAALLPLPKLLNAQPTSEKVPPKYAVVSLIGDELSIVTYQPQTGSVLDTNLHRSVPINDAVFDNAALLAADSAIRKIDQGASPALISVTSAKIYDQQGALFHGSRISLPGELDSALKQVHATHLILITKYSGETRLHLQDLTIGSGRLTGLGYYVDPRKGTRRSDTGEYGSGFLAPFVYITVSLVDLKSLELISDKTVTASTVLSSARNTTGADAWSTLTPDQKVEELRKMIDFEVRRVVPLVLTAPEKH